MFCGIGGESNKENFGAGYGAFSQSKGSSSAG